MSISKVSFSKTPQAADDTFLIGEDAFNISILLDVMANDLGGAAKTLFSSDDGSAITDLLIRDTNGWEATADGNSIRISSGKVEFKLGGPGGAGGWSQADVNALAAGQYAEDSFIYAIQLGN